MDDSEDPPREKLIPFGAQSLGRSAEIVRRGLDALIGQEEPADARKDLVRRLLQQMIMVATEAIYSESVDFDSIVLRLSHQKPGIALLRSYVAIQMATQLTEPLSDGDVDGALERLLTAEQRVDAPEFQAILDVHTELAEIHWLRKTHAILKGKLAHKNDKNSYEGTVYSLELEKKGPTTNQERARYEPICKQMADLNRQIEEKELSLLKDQDEPEYQRYKEELESFALREEIQTNEDKAVELGLAEAISMLETKLDALLHNPEQPIADYHNRGVATQGKDDRDGVTNDRTEAIDIGSRRAEASRQSELDSEAEAEEQRMRNEVERFRPFLKPTEDPKTICSFGQMSFDGDGVEQDYVAAAIWFRIAAEQGYATAQHNLALMYENGEGVPQNYSEAAKWYHMAADQGNPDSQNNLGILYEMGEGVTQDHAAAVEWYRRAAEGGDTNARANYKRLQARVELEEYRSIVFEFIDLTETHSPLIGDCALLPHPKATILYALKFVVDDYETQRDLATDATLMEGYDRMIPTLNYLFTCLARDWNDIAPEDKDAIARLAAYDSFPEWALPLKRKYIDEERASNEALNAAFQVLKDKVNREKADED